MYLVFNVFYFYSGVGQKDSGVGRAHLPPPLCYALDYEKYQTNIRLRKTKRSNNVFRFPVTARPGVN
jgi:hypothetical protein